jgi:hypothetical protein
MSSIQQQKKLVEQLRVECEIRRMPVSQTVNEMIQFTNQYKDEDALIVGIDKKQNPFSEKTSCTIL